MKKKSIIIIVIVGIIVVILGIVLFDLLFPREKRLDEINYKINGPFKAYNVQEEGNDIIVTEYLVNPFRKTLHYQFSDDDNLEKNVITEYYENKLTAICNYFKHKNVYADDVQLKNNTITYTDKTMPTPIQHYTKNDIQNHIDNLYSGTPKVNN